MSYTVYIKLNYFGWNSEIVRVYVNGLTKKELDEIVYSTYGADIIESYSSVTKEEYDNWKNTNLRSNKY